jgi:hypothetical protein
MTADGNTPPAENGSVALPRALSALSARLSLISPSLSSFQAAVGVITGLLTIGSALLAIPQFFKPTADPTMGQLVAIVEEAKTQKAITDARIEILTPQNALITTLTPNYFGKVRRPLEEGPYRIRVSHSRYSAEVRQIHVVRGRATEIHLQLRAGSSSPIDHAERAVREGVGAVKRIFGQ